MHFRYALAAIAVTCVVHSVPTLAADSPELSEQAATRYFKAVPTKQILVDTFTELSKQLPPDQRADFIKRMMGLVRLDVLDKSSKEAMVNVFTADEINALANFYGSKEGASVMKKYGMYMAQVMPVIQQEIQHAIMQQQASEIAGAQPGNTNIEAPGKLESKNDLDCIGADKVENKYTPTDLYMAVSKCANTGRYKEGAFLFAVAGAYGYFDTLRVVDKSAHQAVTVARMQALGTLEKDRKTAFEENAKTVFGNPEGIAAACKEIERIGPPDYYPRYMIQHGMNAFLKSGGDDGLVKDFNAEAAWKQSLGTYLHCPGI